MLAAVAVVSALVASVSSMAEKARLVRERQKIDALFGFDQVETNSICPLSVVLSGSTFVVELKERKYQFFCGCVILRSSEWQDLTLEIGSINEEGKIKDILIMPMAEPQIAINIEPCYRITNQESFEIDLGHREAVINSTSQSQLLIYDRFRFETFSFILPCRPDEEILDHIPEGPFLYFLSTEDGSYGRWPRTLQGASIGEFKEACKSNEMKCLYFRFQRNKDKSKR